jgi:hypothetical protein
MFSRFCQHMASHRDALQLDRRRPVIRRFYSRILLPLITMSAMIARISPWQILIVAAAVIAGVVLDRGLGDQWHAVIGKRWDASAQRAGAGASSPSSAQSARAVATKKADSSETTSAAPMKSLDAILAERDRQQRTRDLEAFINGLSPSDFAEALKRVRRIAGNNERELASRLLVARWVQMDPESALSFAASNRGFEYIADDVFQAEAEVDLQGALDRAKAIPDADLRYMALRGVLSFMVDTDPAGALSLAQTLGNFPGNEPLNSVIYRQWAAQDPQAAALQAVQDTGDGNPWRSPISQVARTWATQDPMAAANWAVSLSDPETEARSISQVMRQWARQDPTAAANWVSALPQGSSYDSAAAALAFSMASSDPQAAVTWADNIADASARTSALQRVSREVMWRDPTNGAAILEAAGVPANLIPPPGQRRGPPRP